MQLMIDIVGSAIIAGVILILVFNLNRSMGDMTFQNTLDVITQENATTIAGMVNSDFYKIGYGESNSGTEPVVEVADTSEIRFRADIDNNGSIDTVHYFVSASPYPVPGSPTKFRKLYRLVNASSGPGASLGITSFKMTYYDTLGVQLSFPVALDSASAAANAAARRQIQSIKIAMMVKNPISADTTLAATFDTTFSATYWEKWISPKNLRRLK